MLVDILIPTYERPGALAVTLTGVAFQTQPALRVVVSDQSDEPSRERSGEVRAAIRLLEHRGHRVETHHHVPRRGLAEQRQFLLDQAQSRYALFLDDDVVIEPPLVAAMLGMIREQGCGFVGSALIGLSYRDDVRPQEQTIELWDGPVRPETVVPGSPAWERYRLHNAANILHVQERLGITYDRPQAYRVAWCGGCVLYDVPRLRECGGFAFWADLPPVHAGEDVLAQLRVMARFGGCGFLPSGAYHQELPTTVPERHVNAVDRLLGPSGDGGIRGRLLRVRDGGGDRTRSE